MRLLLTTYSIAIAIDIILAKEMNRINDLNNTISNFESETSPEKVLSRKKRFLVFPDGSSFQLVFCTQNHGYLQTGNIVWFGNTAALAWELPTDSEIFSVLQDDKRHYDNRRHDSTKSISYLDKDGKVIGQKSYKRTPIVNPAFAKRSIENYPKENSSKNTLTIKEMHKREKKINHLQNLDTNKIEFHRHTRMNLYEKVEKLLEGLGWNGRQCVLRFLCETGKVRAEQGTLLEEILRVTFLLPGGRQFDSVNDYDVAYGNKGECAKMYADCGNISTM